MNEIHRNLAAGGPAGQPPTGPGDTIPAPPAHEPPPRGAGFMNAFRWVLFAGLLVLAAASIGSYVVSKHPKTAAKQVVYQCPMHPSYTSDKPGECPICGMTLEPVESSGPDGAAGAGSGPRRILFYRSPMKPSVTSPVPMKDDMGMDYVPVYSDDAGAGLHGDVPGLTSVNITPERVQLIGVRLAPVERRALGSRLDLVGFVSPDETQLRRIQLRVAGWVQELYVSRTGERVEAGQPLLAIYSPELYQSEQEYLIERSARDSMSAMTHEAGARGASRERLRLLGVPDGEIDRLERERTAATRMVLTAPFTGTVLERGVVEGQYVGADTPLFSLADLSRVWVLADLYEMDFGRVHAGDRVRFTGDALPGRSFDGRVDFVYPTVSSETRTVKLRIALENPRGELRPGMYGRVLVATAGARTLVIPGEAVVNTGESDYVFLARGGGHFEPRMVSVGLQDGEQVQILKGLAEGDTVVASASFLIDSESRLKAAIAGMGRQPETGHPH